MVVTNLLYYGSTVEGIHKYIPLNFQAEFSDGAKAFISSPHFLHIPQQHVHRSDFCIFFKEKEKE